VPIPHAQAGAVSPTERIWHAEAESHRARRAFTERRHLADVTNPGRNLGRYRPKDVFSGVRAPRASLTDLLYRVEQQRRALLAEMLLPRDLNLSQWVALCALAKTSPCTMTELAQTCAADRTSLTRTIDNLVARDLVIRSTPPNDRRTVRVEASPAGRRLAADLLVEVETLENQWLEVFDDAARDRLGGDLETLLARLSPPPRRSSPGR
jgi:DNA-binding MarR family transcriptional regulator